MKKPAKEKSDTLRLIEDGERLLAALEIPSADDAKHWIPLLEWIEAAWRECFSSPPTNAKVTLARLCGVLEVIAHGMPDEVAKLARCRRTGLGNAQLSKPAMRQKVENWDQAIRARMNEKDCGKKQAMRQLQIKSSTYYKYCRLVS
ncbi:MAG: hypothetical protein ACYC3X_06005 [Pirellulaceae bacterium]